MSKFLTVLWHTYFSKLKSKSFIITTIIFIGIIILGANIDKIIDYFGGDEPDQLLIIDETDSAYEMFKTQFEMQEDIEVDAYDGTVEDGKDLVSDGDAKGLLVVTPDDEQILKGDFYQKSSTSMLHYNVENQLQQLKIALATEDSGVDSETLEKIYAEVPFQVTNLDEAAKSEEEMSGARGIVYVMLFLLYMTVMIYGQMIATEVATEKSSRVMEILISSASPTTHMFAKIIGVGLLGLTQILVILAVGYQTIASKVSDLEGEFFEVFGFTSTSTSIYVYAIIFFLLGYFLYATLSAMLGSLVSRVEDVQQLILPITFLIMIAFFIAMFGLSVPDAKFVTITSYIPFFTPMIMFLRVGMLDVPVWEISLSIGILVLTIVLLAIIGARIYRGGVLMYGGSKSLKDIKSAFVMSKKEK